MDLDSVTDASDHKAKLDLYRDALTKLLSQPSPGTWQEFVDHAPTCDAHTNLSAPAVSASEVALSVSRPMLTAVANSLPHLPAEMKKEAAEYVLHKMAGKEVSFEEQMTAIREFIAGLLEEEEDWGEAAKMLAAVDVDRSGRGMTAEDKLKHHIRTTMLFLEDDDSVNAERFLVKAHNLIGEIEDDQLSLQYKACYARICDSKRKFLEAATQYYDLSQSRAGVQTEDSIQQLLQAAVTCAILHPASTHRSRMLAMLYKDERVANVAAVPQFPFLEKMLMERLITKTDVDAFDGMLKEHQRAVLPDGYSVLESAVIQHNIRSVSNMYHNIAIEQLAALLGLPEAQVETLTCDMIAEGRLRGYIDQVGNMVHFEDDTGSLAQWDEQIMGVCDTVNKVVDHIFAIQQSAG